MNGISYLAMFLEPVKPWLDDPLVSEIMINGPENIYIEKGGRVVKIESKFPSEPALQAAANNIAKSVGRVLNDEYPRLDARLPDGSRVHIVIPPLSRCGTVVSIRKFRTDSLSPANLIEWGSISGEMPPPFCCPCADNARPRANAVIHRFLLFMIYISV